MNYFIIPGNPPASHFYELWKKELIALVPHAEVKVSHYPLLAKNANSVRAMEEVLEAHQKQLTDFYQETKSSITIIGHSLGGNIGLKLLNQDQNEMIEQVILLHPFLRRPQRSGQIILKAAALFYGRETIVSSIIKNRRWLEYLSKDLPHVTDEEIAKSFHLARHESQTISLDLGAIKIHPEKKDRVSVFYNRKDTWCPDDVIQELKAQVKILECLEPHSFVTSALHRQNLLAKILT
ncbi:MAG: hypothetical protein H0V66_07130 [Bdellovibrionales bacterium]|nr:hypothetical protein [Bdellovibrionales bacterium]